MLQMVLKFLLPTLLIFIISCGRESSFRTTSSNTDLLTDPVDQYPGELVQSIGTTGAALFSGTGLKISGFIATLGNYDQSSFTSLNIGVGDIITYSGDYAIIKGLSYNTNQVKAYVTRINGYTNPAPTNGSPFSIFHAFTSFTDWNTQTQNANIANTVSLTDTDLTDLDDEWGILNVALYNDGPFTGGSASGWTTNTTTHIRIFTPYQTAETFKRQRHLGVWSSSYVRFEVPGGTDGIDVNVPHIRIEGIQCQLMANGTGKCIKVLDRTGFTNARLYASYNILRGTNDAGNPSSHHDGIQMTNIGTGELYIYNNVAYGFKGAGYCIGIDVYDADYTGVIANNTSVENKYGIMNYDGTAIVARNNIAIDNTDDYYGSWHADSDSNISGSADAPGTNAQNGVTLTFVNKAALNFNLVASDIEAIDNGIDMSGDPDIPFSDDITHTERTGSWDIGAFNY